MYLWHHYQTQSYHRLVSAAEGAGIPLPSVVLWTSHLTQAEYIHYIDNDTYTIQIWTDAQVCTHSTHPSLQCSVLIEGSGRGHD